MTSIMLIGEAFGEQEDYEKMPFVGASGYELTRMLEEAGIHRADCYLTNVFNFRPQNNNIETLCGEKATRIPGYPALTKGKYVRAEFQTEMDRLASELIEADPNVVIACGNTPFWALCGQTGISKLRGAATVSTHTVEGFKVIPTYHPAAVLRQWDLRPVTVIDFIKAKRESAYPELRRPKREIWIEPSLDDMGRFYNAYICRCKLLSVDIETIGNQITCVGFAPSASVSLVVPFRDNRKLGHNYWPTKATELQAWSYVRRILEDKTIPKLFQNGLYDIAFLWRAYGIRTLGAREDTMLMHHALQPESLKGLGFLGSVYTDEGSWKHMRSVKTIKRDE